MLLETLVKLSPAYHRCTILAIEWDRLNRLRQSKKVKRQSNRILREGWRLLPRLSFGELCMLTTMENELANKTRKQYRERKCSSKH